jgi:dTDP-4-dehydrorhamnose 3,5-epimerase
MPDWQTTSIPGVLRRALTFHADERGSLAEIWRATWMDADAAGSPPEAVLQANLSSSRPRVLRGLHVHQRQVDVWVVLAGHAFIGLVDVRGPLLGDGPVRMETLEAVPGDVLYLPRGVAHGFYARDELTLLYFVTNPYDGSDEHGFAWDDPMAAVPWPDPTPILSARDQAAPALSDLLDQMRRGPQQTESR